MGNESLRIIQQSGNNYDGYTKMLDIFLIHQPFPLMSSIHERVQKNEVGQKVGKLHQAKFDENQ